jgi:adenylate cyclase
LLVLAVVGLGSAGVAVAAYATDVLQRFEGTTVDTRFSIRGARTQPGDVALVALDRKTFSDLNVSGPFPRSLHARALDRIMRDHPAAVAYDVQFSAGSTTAEDSALIEAVDRARGKVAFATAEVFGPHGEHDVLGGQDVLDQIGARAGHSVFPADSDGVIRHMVYANDHLESFSLVAAEIARQRRISSSALGGRRAWIDYAGPPGTISTTSFSDVLRGRFPPGRFTGRVVVVGELGIPVLNLPTPTGKAMAESEIQANGLRTALHGFPLRSWPDGLNLALIVVLGLAVPLASLRLGAAATSTVAIVLGALFVVAAQLAFDAGRVVPFVYPLLGLTLSSFGVLTHKVHYAAVDFERERVRALFSRFVPEPVVDELLARTQNGLRLAGTELESTVMFCDLREFTGFAEALPAGRVIDVLNRYLGEMSEAILDHGGTLVAYMGDGIMAVFGAPLEQSDHADRALAASREMLTVRLPRFNAWLAEQGMDHRFRMGIGLNSGSVMSGNVGSERRLEYTAVGDTVNTASRLEAATKNAGFQLLVADSTRARLSDHSEDLVFVEEHAVRGRQATVRLWTLTGVR